MHTCYPITMQSLSINKIGVSAIQGITELQDVLNKQNEYEFDVFDQFLIGI